MERFFTQHSVQWDRDADELAGRARSDSEASSSDDSGSEQQAADRVHSVHDPTGPWRQTPVGDGQWGQPAARSAGRKARDFQSKYTGPKGVLNDYKAHKRSVRDERARKEQERRDVLSRITKGVVAPVSTSSSSSTRSATNLIDDCVCDGDSDCDCDCDDLVDAAFLQQYQQQRLQELADAVKRRKVFGSLETISPEQFVALLDTADLHRVLLVHLFHPDNDACRLLNAHLAVVAQRIPHVQFTAMVAQDADASIALHDVPVLLIYRGDHLDDTVLRVTTALDGEFTLARVLALVNERLATLYGM